MARIASPVVERPGAHHRARGRLLDWLLWQAILGLIALGVAVVPPAPVGLPLTLTAVVEEACAGRVAAVTTADQHLAGTFTAPRRLVDGRVLAADERPPAGQPARTSTAFWAPLPAADREAVVSRLGECGVPVRPDRSQPAFLTLLALLSLVISLVSLAPAGPPASGPTGPPEA